MKTSRRPLCLLLAAAFPAFAQDTAVTFGEVVVTAPQMRDPLVIANNPKAPQVPVPANDGASFLKNIPGFNVVRKGGTDGDPVLRGLAGSRLPILLDGAEFHGGCGMRMDPPTAYVFPEAFDRVVVIKGPQTVRYGNGNLAGVVSFERDAKPFKESGARAFGSLMVGSWGRLDGVVDATFGNPNGYLRASGTHSESDDYEDGNGRKVHSLFKRDSLNFLGGWTPDANTRIEISAARSGAEAAYADRTMDGVVFDREGYGIKFERKRISEVLRKVEAQYNDNYIDHVMDNYSLRTKSVANYMWNNPDRKTKGLRASAEMNVGKAAVLTVGADWQNNLHTLRTFSNAVLAGIDTVARGKDLEATTTGVFGELTYALSDGRRLLAGLRHDRFSVDRFTWSTGAANGSAKESLNGGFLRYEHDLSGQPATAYMGLGRGERPMDHWEATTYNGLTAAGKLNPETNTQIDAGLIWNGENLNGSLSAYYSKIGDYVLTRNNNTSSNVDATRHGLEADVAWRFAKQWTMRGSYAYVHADNDTMGVPLAQTPPHELKLGLDWQAGSLTLGGLARLVGGQDRVHIGYGNVVGQDLGATGGFATLALNGSYRFDKKTLLSVGVDNVFDRIYAEHISRTGSTAISGYTTDIRVNEPGRFVWVKASFALD
ncbi:MAG: TonB-dependent copper receptor [Candidatus Nitricoxidivorans perseverans]|uniref:TonB-dependent copper receptor n=1 Tax=Candidatus Nitricoxidivorans perseverans TaxID=2975601 RepID=A0AA49IXM8_9PROT|nr:MAG: TonB-dependent copper receptor [Candidatus Nitricoxidivorans perseverans]